MKVWYPDKQDLRRYIETFNVQDRQQVKETLKKAILDYDRLLADHKTNGKLTPGHQTFGAFLNYLEVNKHSIDLFILEDELYGFSRWHPSDDALDYYEYQGYWPQLIEQALLECTLNSNGIAVEDPEAYFDVFIRRRYHLEDCDPNQLIPNHILKVIEQTTSRPIPIILSLIKDIRQKWYHTKSMDTHPRYYYRFVVTELASMTHPRGYTVARTK